MPVIIIIGGLKICIYANDHIPPHVHAMYAEHEVLIDIRDCFVLQGKLPAKVLRKAFSCIGIYKEELLNEFYRLNPQIKQK